MKRAMMIVAVASVLLVLSGTARAIPPGTVYVDDGFTAATPGWGTTHFDTIQDGLDAVAVGGTVNVANGTYGADVGTGKCADITKSLDLIGESRDGVVIDGSIGSVGSSGSYWPKGVHVNAADNVTVKNLTVTGFTGDQVSSGGYGVLFRDYAHDDLAEGLVTYSNGTVENVKVVDGHYGIYSLVNEHLTVRSSEVDNCLGDGMFIARASHHAVIEGNTVTGSGNHGIWFGQDWAAVAGSDNGLVKDNTVTDSVEGGITISDSSSTTVTGNTVTGTDPSTLGWDPWAVGALSVMDGSTDITVTGNHVYNNDVAGLGLGTPGGSTTLSDILIGGSAADYNEVRNNAGGGVWFRNVTATTNIVITHNNLYGNTGDDFDCMDGGGITSTITADARYNWWGADSDPVVAGVLLFDTPGDNILYQPWAAQEYVIPEPAGLGLIGLALLAVRRKRS